MTFEELEELYGGEGISEEMICCTATDNIDQWITDLIEIPVSQSGHYDWGDVLPSKLCYQLSDSYLTPVPFSSQWWAAGMLLDEMSEELEIELLHSDGWGMSGSIEGVPTASNGPEVIARTYLIAVKRGLLEVKHA